MTNPWLEIKNKYSEYKNEENFILGDERKIVKEFNTKTKNENFKIHKYILPFPYVGNVNKPEILILVNNPGFDTKELENGYYKEFHDEILESYEGNKPMYCFDDEYVKFSDYWFKKLGVLINKFGKEKVSNKISIINYFPYSSTKFKDFSKKTKKEYLENEYLKSQQYNFELVENAMNSNALIIIVRGRKNWYKSVDGLKDYKNKFETNSYLNSSITPNNCKGFFDKIEEKFN